MRSIKPLAGMRGSNLRSLKLRPHSRCIRNAARKGWDPEARDLPFNFPDTSTNLLTAPK